MGFRILQGIDNEYSGDTKKRLSKFIFEVLSPSEYFATKVNKAVKKNEKIIIRIITKKTWNWYGRNQRLLFEIIRERDD